MEDDQILQILGVAEGDQEHFRQNVVVCHRVFENDHRIVQNFLLEFGMKNHLGISSAWKRMDFDSPPILVFIASEADFVPIFVFSDAHRDLIHLLLASCTAALRFYELA